MTMLVGDLPALVEGLIGGTYDEVQATLLIHQKRFELRAYKSDYVVNAPIYRIIMTPIVEGL